MNERIRELRRQATLVETYTTNSGAIAEGKHVDLEKFAQLIVQECIEAIQNKSMNSSDEWEDGLEIAESALKEHFGVEE